jgi:hypothetical protein
MKQTTTQIFSALCILGAPAAAQIQFTSAGTVATGQLPDAVVIADFDLDGDQDMAVTTGPQAGNLDAVEIYANNGLGTYTLSATILTGNNTGPGGLVAADLNGDGAADLAIALHNSSQVRVIMNNGAGAFTSAGSTSVGFDPRALSAGDVDGDGDTDVVSSNRDGNSVSLLMNNGSGVLSLTGTATLGADLRGVAIADFNGDGLGDVVVSSHDTRQIGVLMGTGAGLGAPTMYSVGAGRRSEGVTTGDFNGDGLVDIAAATSLNNDSWATIFTNAGGAFGAAQHFAFQGIDADSIVAADFDLDGDQDLATSNQGSNNVSVLSGAGNGTFGFSTVVGTGVRPGSIVAGDMDGDGDADLATANRDSNNVSLLENPGTGAAWSNYCTATANSTGGSASIGASGSNSILANDFTLQVTGAVPNTSGMFVYAATQGFSALGDGNLCLSGQLFRLHTPTPANGAGDKNQLLNFQVGNPSSGPGLIVGGSNWNFQYWYRDVAGGGSGFNLSDGLNATFGL